MTCCVCNLTLHFSPTHGPRVAPTGTKEVSRGTPACSDLPSPAPRPPALTHSGSRSPRSVNSLGRCVSTARLWLRSGSSAWTGHTGRHTEARHENPEGTHVCRPRPGTSDRSRADVAGGQFQTILPPLPCSGRRGADRERTLGDRPQARMTPWGPKSKAGAGPSGKEQDNVPPGEGNWLTCADCRVSAWCEA